MSEYQEPRSICKCGHTGDGRNSQHDICARVEGAGMCKVKGCDCSRFTWKNFIDKFVEHMKGGHDG